MKQHVKTDVNLFGDVNIDAIWNKNYSCLDITLENNLKIYRSDGKNTIQFLYVYKPNAPQIKFEDVRKFIDFLHAVPVDEHGVNLLPVFVNLHGTIFADKMVYIMFETIILYLITKKNWLISLEGKIKSENCSNGVGNSSLTCGNWSINAMSDFEFKTNLLNWNKAKINRYKYTRVETECVSHTRYYVNPLNEKNNIASDIFEFLKNSSILQEVGQDTIRRISNTILEIKSNCAEHTKSPYIYDIDIKKVIHGERSKLKGNSYISINVALWDFSNVCIGDAIKEKIRIIESLDSTEEQISAQIGKKEKVFNKLLNAHKAHKNFLTDVYTSDDFFSLTAFQPGVTGRSEPESTGGAGLSHVLDFLKEYPDGYKCYCLTGNTIINFDREFLNKDDYDWYTFNSEQNSPFFNTKPSISCTYKAPFFYPGTAFFLHLEIN